ncbi:hypothetical protein BGX21_011128 [Mortierella sp. AD011]|nr:hypothetical protein BGX20_001024 [Mortierella sp. AD010]KAF9391880.1 hypothetical protein BGX21_011128 [Mortierella sp. AD011]
MTSPSSWSVALRHTSSQAVRQYRPLSVQFQSVRWASIVPYSVNEHSFYSPPPPPMTLEQIQQHVQRKQQLLLEEQVQLEQRQRMRQQQELQIQLAKHRNAILEQQQQQQQEMQKELAEYRKSILKQKQEQEQQQQQQQELAQVRHDQQVHAEGGKVEKAQVEHETRAQETSSSSTPLPETDASRHQFIPTWRRTMFGYRGPEQVIMDVNTAATGDSTAATLLEMEQESMLKSVSRRSISTMITAENRVRLTLLDYTPKQIDAMTPIQADAILSSKEQQEGNQRKQKQGQQEQSALKSEAPAATTTSRKLLSVKELNDNKGEYNSVHTMTSFVSAPVGSVNMDVQVKGNEQQHQQDRFALRGVSDVMAPTSTPSSRVLASSQRNHEGHVTSSSSTRRPTGNSSSSPSTL